MSKTNDELRELYRSMAHTLITAEVHNGMRQNDGLSEREINEQLEKAQALAYTFIELAGFDSGDSDRRGGAMDEYVHDFLTLVALLIGLEGMEEVLG